MRQVQRVVFFIQRCSTVFLNWRWDVAVLDGNASVAFQLSRVTGGKLLECDTAMIPLNLEIDDDCILQLIGLDPSGKRLIAYCGCSPVNTSPQYYNVVPAVSPGAISRSYTEGSERQGGSASIKTSEMAKGSAGLPFVAQGEVAAGAEQTYNGPVDKRSSQVQVTEVTPTEIVISFSMSRVLAVPSISGSNEGRGHAAFG